MGGSDRAAVHKRRSRHSFSFASTACCNNWFECSHSHSRRHRWHVAFQEDIHGSIYQKCGTHNRTWFVDISKLTWSLADSVCDSLIGLHAFTSYETVSAFASRWKLSSLKLMKMDITYQETFSQVGQTWDVQHSYLRRYNNSLVVWMWLLAALPRWTTCDISSFVRKGERLSPDCYHHADIVSSCTSFEPTTRHPPGSDVCLLVPQWPILPSVDGYMMMTISPFTECGHHQQQLLACKCVRSCKLPKCTSMANRLACTEMCYLQSSSYQKQQEDKDDIVELGDSDDDID